MKTHPIALDLAEYDRRSFLKLGLASSALLGSAGFTATLSGCSGAQQPAATGFAFLRDADLVLFKALLPVILQGVALPPAVLQEALVRIDAACLLAQAPAQAEVRKLFDLLNIGLLRRISTGVKVPWDQASAEDVSAFLTRWRNSSVGLLNAGYRALVKVACVAYFGQTISREVSGYPGPLAAMYKAVNGLGAGT